MYIHLLPYTKTAIFIHSREVNVFLVIVSVIIRKSSFPSMDTPPPPPPPPPHVLLFPLPLQGPINCMLKLAELFCVAGINVTFLNTLHNHRRLLRCSDAAYRFARFSDLFRFESFPDGLPEHHPRSTVEVIDSVETTVRPLLRRILMPPTATTTNGRVTCVVADGIFGYAVEIAEEFRVPLLYFDTISPCCLSVYLSLPKLIQSHELPFNCDDDLDIPIRNVSGMESFLRRRDLPSFCRSGDLSDPVLQLILTEAREIPKARGLIVNTLEELEGPETLSHLRGICPNLYAIGPLHSLLRTRLAAGKTEEAPSLVTSSNSLWEEDGSCIGWLDAQPPRSVVYISIGSLAVMTAKQAMEVWRGLVNSGHRFLWVRRPGSIINDDDDDDGELIPTTGLCAGARGCMVRWAPQEEVLAHAAVGAFLTHSGWNSTLESVVTGVPMICWPYFADQQVNSRHVSCVWGLGLDMKDTCDRATVEGMVRDLMEVRRDQFFQSAQRAARLARESVAPGGSSFSNLDRLIEDIRLMSTRSYV